MESKRIYKKRKITTVPMFPSTIKLLNENKKLIELLQEYKTIGKKGE